MNKKKERDVLIKLEAQRLSRQIIEQMVQKIIMEEKEKEMDKIYRDDSPDPLWERYVWNMEHGGDYTPLD